MKLTLTKGELRRVECLRSGVSIRCDSGRVWVTQAGDRRDLVLRRGESRETAGCGAVLVESLEPAVVWIAARQEQKILHRWRVLWSRLPPSEAPLRIWRFVTRGLGC